jgi:hypothetical protein
MVYWFLDLHHVRQEKNTAIAATYSAAAAKDTAERAMRAAETALAAERTTRRRTKGMLRGAEATIRDFREKLATANHDLQTIRAADRLAGQEADDVPLPAMAVEETVMATARDAAVPIIRRPVGRPRKVAVKEPIKVSNEPRILQDGRAPPNRDATAPTGRRPVGRPRKAAMVQPVGEPIGPSGKPLASAEIGTKKTDQQTDDQEPVQWWVEGWRGR